MARPKKYSSKELSNHLRELAAEAETVLDDGTCLTKGEVLARLIFKKALGYEDRTTDPEGNEKLVKHDPATWAIQLIWERLEGKAPMAITDDETKLKVADKVSDLAKNRLNSMAQKLVAASAPKTKPGPPSFKRDD